MTPEAQRISDAFYIAFVLWREARGESRDGKVAVAYSILNRVAHPKWWGSDIASVVTKPWQYSSMTAPGDPNLIQYPGQKANDGWAECIDVALQVLDQKVANPVPGADSYYATSMVHPPNWAKPEQFVGQIGHHRFYNTDGDHPENVAGIPA